MNFYPGNDQPDEAIDLFQHPEKPLLLLSHLYSSFNPGNYCSDFYHHRLVVPDLELYIHGIIQ